jgi:hypothetical protein
MRWLVKMGIFVATLPLRSSVKIVELCFYAWKRVGFWLHLNSGCHRENNPSLVYFCIN